MRKGSEILLLTLLAGQYVLKARCVASDCLKGYNSPMNLVNEDKFGAYLGINDEFLKEFVPKERNPNFEVFDSRDNYRRFIAVKSSRLPDDQDLPTGRYGIDFNRPKPGLEQALEYGAELPDGFKWLSESGFAAFTEEEYENKSSTWDDFYANIWGLTPQTVWVAPHSGRVTKKPDNRLLYPQAFIDTGTAGVAASCAYNDRDSVSKRIMIAIHATGFLGAVINLGDFGVADEAKMDAIAEKIELKFHDRVQVLADEFKQDFCNITLDFVENIHERTGTLHPDKLDSISGNDALTVRFYEKGLKLYGQEIKAFTLAEFKQALENLGKIDVPVISNNYLHSARYVGQLLKLAEKIELGLLQSALNVECARIYIANDPDLVSEIVMDVKKELFG